MNLLSSTSVFGFYTLLSRVLGYLRDILIAVFLGTSIYADAFFVALDCLIHSEDCSPKEHLMQLLYQAMLMQNKREMKQQKNLLMKFLIYFYFF